MKKQWNQLPLLLLLSWTKLSSSSQRPWFPKLMFARGGGSGGGTNNNNNKSNSHSNTININTTNDEVRENKSSAVNVNVTKSTTTSPPLSSSMEKSILESYVEHVSQQDDISHSFYEKQNQKQSTKRKEKDICDTVDDDDDDNEEEDNENGQAVIQLKKKENGLNDPNDSDDDSDNDGDDGDDGNDNNLVNRDIDVDMLQVQKQQEEEAVVDHLKVDIINLPTNTNDNNIMDNATPNTNQKHKSGNDATATSPEQNLTKFDQALINSFLPILYPPPSHNIQSFIHNHLQSKSTQIDVSSRRRFGL